jgi:hypothetical protein
MAAHHVAPQRQRRFERPLELRRLRPQALEVIHVAATQVRLEIALRSLEAGLGGTRLRQPFAEPSDGCREHRRAHGWRGGDGGLRSSPFEVVLADEQLARRPCGGRVACGGNGRGHGRLGAPRIGLGRPLQHGVERGVEGAARTQPLGSRAIGRRRQGFAPHPVPLARGLGAGLAALELRPPGVVTLGVRLPGGPGHLGHALEPHHQITDRDRGHLRIDDALKGRQAGEVREVAVGASDRHGLEALGIDAAPAVEQIDDQRLELRAAAAHERLQARPGAVRLVDVGALGERP